jgi:hypothetical protein
VQLVRATLTWKNPKPLRLTRFEAMDKQSTHSLVTGLTWFSARPAYPVVVVVPKSEARCSI